MATKENYIINKFTDVNISDRTIWQFLLCTANIRMATFVYFGKGSE